MKELKITDVAGLIPERRIESNKGDYGRLLSVCGSRFYRGAAVLSSEAALRCGVGILRLASIEKVCAAVASSVPEATFLPLEESDDGSVLGFEAASVFESDPRISAVLCGCGLTVSVGARSAVLGIIESSPCTVVLDADALNCLKSDPSVLRKAAVPPVITPHWGEFSRLCGRPIPDVEKNAETLAKEFAAEYNCIVVLKSHYTVIADPSGECFISRYGNAGLARGGSGDILAGMIASFAAQGLSAIDAAKLGTALHGAAADRCAARLGMTGMLPRDVIADLTELLKEMRG